MGGVVEGDEESCPESDLEIKAGSKEEETPSGRTVHRGRESKSQTFYIIHFPEFTAIFFFLDDTTSNQTDCHHCDFADHISGMKMFACRLWARDTKSTFPKIHQLFMPMNESVLPGKACSTSLLPCSRLIPRRPLATTLISFSSCGICVII